MYVSRAAGAPTTVTKHELAQSLLGHACFILLVLVSPVLLGAVQHQGFLRGHSMHDEDSAAWKHKAGIQKPESMHTTRLAA